MAGTDSVKITSGQIGDSLLSGSDVIFYVGSDTLTFKNSANERFKVVDNIIALREGPPTVTGTAKGDNLSNNEDEALINALAGNDQITNSGNEVTIDAGAGTDTINNTGSNVYLDGGAGSDKITIDGKTKNVTIEGGAGADTIYLSGESNLINYAVGDGKDTIYGFGETDSIQLTSGTVNRIGIVNGNMIFTIDSGTSNVITVKDGGTKKFKVDGSIIMIEQEPDLLISGSGKADTLDNDETGATIDALAGNDTIENSGNSVSISGGSGNDKITNTGNEVTINGDAGNDTIITGGNSVMIDGDAGKDVIYGFNDNDTIQLVNGRVNRTVISNNKDVIFYMDSGTTNAITLKDSTGKNFKIDGAEITIDDTGVKTISGSAKADNLVNTESGVVIAGFAGNDTITNSGNEVTIDAGADTIYSNGKGNLIEYATGDGKDTIFGFGGRDSIQLTSGTVSKTLSSGANVLVTIGSGTTNVITLKDVANKNLSIDGDLIMIEDNAPTTIKGSSKAENLSNDKNNAVIDALAGNDTINNSGSNVSISGGNGADTIYSNGKGNLIEYATGGGKDVIFGFSGNDSIEITSGAIKNYAQSNSNVLVTVGSGTTNVITLKDISVENLAVSDNVIYMANNSAHGSNGYWFTDDNNFNSGEVSLSEIVAENYSVTNIETPNYENLAQDDKILVAYSDK